MSGEGKNPHFFAELRNLVKDGINQLALNERPSYHKAIETDPEVLLGTPIAQYCKEKFVRDKSWRGV